MGSDVQQEHDKTACHNRSRQGNAISVRRRRWREGDGPPEPPLDVQPPLTAPLGNTSPKPTGSPSARFKYAAHPSAAPEDRRPPGNVPTDGPVAAMQPAAIMGRVSRLRSQRQRHGYCNSFLRFP